MPKPLGYFDPTMLEGTTPASLIASVKANALACGWQIVREDTSASPFIDLIPPSAQTIGDSLWREVIRLRAPAASNSLDVHTILEAPIGTPLLRTLQNVGSLSVDYTYGFIYYLAVMERTLLIGTKTSTAVYGALFASYAENSLAVAATPPGLVPIELIGGSLADPVSKFGVSAVTTHCFGYATSAATNNVPDPANPYVYDHTGFGLSDAITGALTANYGVLRNLTSYCWSSSRTVEGFVGCGGWGTAVAATVLGSPAMVSCGLLPVQKGSSGYVSDVFTTYAAWLPALPLPDVTAYLATAVNEGLHLVRSLVTTTLQTEMDGTSDYPTITLGSTADLPTSGVLVIGDECIPYTGKSGNTVTGCTRNAYATSKAAHAVGTTVYLASWVVKVNGCAIHAGYAKPGN